MTPFSLFNVNFKAMANVDLLPDPINYWTDEMSVKMTVKIRKCQEVKVTLGQTFTDGHINWIWTTLHPEKEIVTVNVPERFKSGLIEDLRNRGNICLVFRPIHFYRPKMNQIPGFLWDEPNYFRVWATLNTNTGKSWYVKAVTQIQEQSGTSA